MKIALILVACLLQASFSQAENVCYDADSDKFVRSAVEPLSLFSQSMPGVYQVDAPKVTWEKLDSDTKSQVDIIGYHHGAAIIRVIYTSFAPDRGSDITCAVLAYQVALPDKEMSAFPFYILSGGEQLSSFEAQFISTDSLPFGLQAHMTMKGTGVFWSACLFRFGKHGPVLIERTDGGRKMKETTKKYKES